MQAGFLPWEVATGLPQSAQPGMVPPRFLTVLTLALFGAAAAALYPLYGLPALVVSLFFARQMALDLTTYTLADVYTLPAMAVALAAAYSHGTWPDALWGGTAMAVLAAIVGAIQWLAKGRGLGMGGGDTKLLLAMGLWLGPVAGLTALAVGCLAWWPVTWLKPKAQQPFGVAIAVGWVILLCWPHLPNHLFLPI